MPKKSRSHRISVFKIITMSILAGGFVITGLFVLWISSFQMPDLNSLEQIKVSQSTKIYDRTGRILLYDVHQDVRRTIVPFDKISRNLKNATIAIEDPGFYQHGGIEIKAILRAIVANLGTLRFGQGGSTITQQVVKNTILTNDKTISRKLKEWVLSLKLERVMGKESILALYLNESPYGGNIYGIEEASQTYFGKSANDLDVAESAYLAAIPNAPTYYSPYGNNKDKLAERENLILKKMLENKFINSGDYQTALKEKITFLPQAETGLLAPHFVLFVKQYLESKYGPVAVEDEGLKVITSLDYNLQLKAEETVKKWALQNEVNFKASNASLVAVDPKTGQILAMVGSRNYFDPKIDGNYNVALALRQPGSSFKPFVYATAFEKGYTPDTVLFDLPTEFSTYCNSDGTPIIATNSDKCYMPVDFDGNYLGPISLRNALAQSRNIPAIKLLYLSGLQDSLQTAKDMGITSLGDANQYGLTLVLGGGEVSLLDMTSAYSVFANDGVRNPYQSILEVDDTKGSVLEKYSPNPTQVIPKNAALTVTDVLADNKARAPEFGESSVLYFPGHDVAVKTGTTNDYRDAWVIGYTPSIAVGAWAGNNDNSPMEKRIAGFIVAPMWNEFMNYVLASSSPTDRFEKPEEPNTSNLKPLFQGFWQGDIPYFIDSVSGKLATDLTPPETKVEKVVKDVHSILYWVDRNNPSGPKPENPSNDPQFQLWESPIRKWVAEQGIQEETTAVIPTAYDDVHTTANVPKISILGLDGNKKYDRDQKVYASISNTPNPGQYQLSKVDYFLNDRFIGSSSQYPFAVSFTPSAVPNIENNNILKAVGYDSVFNRGETSINFSIQ